MGIPSSTPEEQDGNTLVYRVGQLEDAVDDLKKKIDTLRTNDIPCIQKELLALKTRVNTLAAINVGAIVVTALIAALIGKLL